MCKLQGAWHCCWHCVSPVGWCVNCYFMSCISYDCVFMTCFMIKPKTSFHIFIFHIFIFSLLQNLTFFLSICTSAAVSVERVTYLSTYVLVMSLSQMFMYQISFYSLISTLVQKIQCPPGLTTDQWFLIAECKSNYRPTMWLLFLLGSSLTEVNTEKLK